MFVSQGKMWTQEQSGTMPGAARAAKPVWMAESWQAKTQSMRVLQAKHFIYFVAAWTWQPVRCPDWEYDSKRRRLLYFQDNEACRCEVIDCRLRAGRWSWTWRILPSRITPAGISTSHSVLNLKDKRHEMILRPFIISDAPIYGVKKATPLCNQRSLM